MTKPYKMTSPKYGITEWKKEELDALSLQVQDAQYDVQQLQAIVNSLTAKSQAFQAYLATADSTRTQALNDMVQVDALVQSTLVLRDNSGIAFNEMVAATERTKMLAIEVNRVMNKLIYAADVINKLANMIIRKKALNPLISDELVSTVTAAGQDANNAVALMLTALQSVFTSQASALESEAVASLEFTEAETLYATISKNFVSPPACLQELVHQAYNISKQKYENALQANTETTVQLNEATLELKRAQVRLQSLQSGLAAANAAALAS